MDRWKALQAERDATRDTARSELVRARDDTIICDLSGYGLLQVEGEDAETFLQGQLSSDVCGLTQDRCQLATYNSPKGRVLATLLLWRIAQGFLLQLPFAIAEAARRRLAMFVLRSKVRIDSASDRFIRIGIGGPHAERVMTAAGIVPPQQAFGILRRQRVDVTGQPLVIDFVVRQAAQCYELLLADENAALEIWRLLQGHGAEPARFDAWRWLTLRAGIAEVGTETQDKFVAQMLNYELIGGISFTKGCYPGQEIIARTQYRGSLKRRTLLAHVHDAVEPAPGISIFAESGDGQAIGAVVNAAPSPESGFDMLVSVHMELAAGPLHLGSSEGPLLDLLTMPYPVPVPA